MGPVAGWPHEVNVTRTSSGAAQRIMFMHNAMRRPFARNAYSTA
jgi:hypothetical protein